MLILQSLTCFQRSLKAVPGSANLTLHITILFHMAFSPGAGQVWSGVTPLSGCAPERGAKEARKLQLVQEILGGSEEWGGKAGNCIETYIKEIYFCFWNGCGGQWWQLTDGKAWAYQSRKYPSIPLTGVESIPAFNDMGWNKSRVFTKHGLYPSELRTAQGQLFSLFLWLII